jgi:hypothetical protein
LGKSKEAAMHYSIAADNRKYPYTPAGLTGMLEKNPLISQSLKQEAMEMLKTI